MISISNIYQQQIILILLDLLSVCPIKNIQDEKKLVFKDVLHDMHSLCQSRYIPDVNVYGKKSPLNKFDTFYSRSLDSFAANLY